MLHIESMSAIADGSELRIYESIHLEGYLRNKPCEVEFLVCCISDNAILGMEFLEPAGLLRSL